MVYVTEHGFLKVVEIVIGRVLSDGRLQIKRKNNKRAAQNGPYEVVSLADMETAVNEYLSQMETPDA